MIIIPDLYRPYSREEAVSSFGLPPTIRGLCDGQWIVRPNFILCFATIGEASGLSYFRTASRFCWAADKPYRVSEGDVFQRVLPKEVHANHEVERRIELFVRRQGEDRYVYLGRLGTCHSYGAGRRENFGEAEFELQRALPIAVWNRLNGTEGLKTNILDAAMNRLDGPLAMSARLEISRELVEYFHGPILPREGMTAQELPTISLPEPLRWWYKLIGNRERMGCSQNYFIDPRRLHVDENGKLPFYRENQACYLWATSPAGGDPPVWGQFLGPLGLRRESWIQEGMKLSEFLIQSCLFEAIFAAPYGASKACADQETLGKVIKPLKEVPLPPWHWPAFPTRFFYGGGVIASTNPNECEDTQVYDIWVGAMTEHPLAYLKEVVDEEWEYVAI